MLKRINYISLFLIIIVLVGCVTVSRGNYPPFIKAALDGNTFKTDQLLREGEFPNQTTIGNQTALHVAAAEGQNEMVKWLLAREANPIAEDQNGETPADFANSQDNSDTAKIIEDFIELLQAEEAAISNADIPELKELLAEDSREYSILHVLAQYGAVDEMKIEIESGADVNAQTALELTPMHKAISGGHISAATLLIENGADVNIVDVFNNSPLYYAVLKENPEMAELFLDAGAKVDIVSAFGGETILEYAERKGNAEIIKLLNEK